MLYLKYNVITSISIKNQIDTLMLMLGALLKKPGQVLRLISFGMKSKLLGDLTLFNQVRTRCTKIMLIKFSLLSDSVGGV